MSVFFNLSNGTFAREDYFVGPNYAVAHPMGVAVGDVNGDGHPDVAVANSGDNTVSLLLGDGVGLNTFKNYSVDGDPFAVEVGDVDGGDGRLDIIAANNYIPGSVSVLRNGGCWH